MAGTRRLYLCLALIRLYFALSPSYIHPDEHFQGPEIIAGELFGWNVTKTWEFMAEKPIRSYFPLLAVYAAPMTVLQWIANGDPSPTTLFYAIRVLFYFFSMVYEDWALLELGSATVPNMGLLLTGSSWVTWSIQARSFSNSVETVLVLWSLVFLQRIVSTKGTSMRNCFLLAAFVVFGTFNRITFPAFLFIPGISLLKHFVSYPLSFVSFTVPALLLTASVVVLDTHLYTLKPIDSLSIHDLVITPLNNLIYNSSTSNLAQHGLHPYYTHILANLPQLLGPAFISLFFSLNLKSLLSSIPLQSAISGVVTLSVFKHQELRFLIPVVPLVLSSISLPSAAAGNWRKMFLGSWITFNTLFGVLMGVFHQGGVVPAQLHISAQRNVDTVIWWKTYKPPTWLLGAKTNTIETVDLMGGRVDRLVEFVENTTTCGDGIAEGRGRKFVVAPTSAVALDPWIYNFDEDLDELAVGEGAKGFVLHKVFEYTKHLNLDDMDFGDDGFIPTVQRVIGRRGIAVYEVEKLGCGRASRFREIVKGKVEGLMEKLGSGAGGAMEGIEGMVRGGKEEL